MEASMKYYKVGSQVYAFLADGSEDSFIPEGASPLSDDEIYAVLNPPPYVPTREEVEAARQVAYADPEMGSDRLFAQAARMEVMGEPGVDAVRAAAIARYKEIQQSLPYPD